MQKACYDYVMPPLIQLAIITGLPLALAVLLRVKPLYLFVSIVTGYFWAQFLGEPAELILRSMVHMEQADIAARVGLLLIPVGLTFALMRKTLSTAALPFQFFLLVADSILLATFLLPLLTISAQDAIYQNTYSGNIMRQAHDVIIAGVAALHLLVMFVMRPKIHGKGKRRKH